jgi:LPXTG-motif cell wall-anchored protein
VEQLAQGLVVRDNSDLIESQLDEHNSRNGSSCACTSGREQTAMFSSAGVAALLGMALVVRRRRKR